MSNQMVITKKAFQIDLDRLEEGFLTDSIICYADSVNKAKQELLRQVMYDGWKLKYSGEELTYLNIPVIRRMSSDKVIFEGKEVLRGSIPEIIQERERKAELDEILNNPNIKYCYIIKGGYYRPNSCGYTLLKFEAGIYTKEEAVSHAKSVRSIRLEPVDEEEHNKMINQKIDELRGQLL